MKTLKHTVHLPDGSTLAATITLYGSHDVTLPEHIDLYRPQTRVWGVAEIHDVRFSGRVWTVSTDTSHDAKQTLRRELDTKARAMLGYPADNPYASLAG